MTTPRSYQAIPPARRPRRRPRGALPELLRPLFWDVRFGSLRWDADRDLVIGRILSAGGLKTWAWLRRRLGDAALRDWLLDRRGRGLTPKQLRYWELVLGISRRRVNSWLADPARFIWDWRCQS